MLKFKPAHLLCLALPLLLGASAAQDRIGHMKNDAFMNRRAKARDFDKNELRAQVDETQSLLDSLARETRRLKKDEREALFKDLAKDYELGSEVGYARKALEKAEDLLDIQDSIRQQQARLKEVLGDIAKADKEEQKLLGMQSDLLVTVEDLRKVLTNQQKDLNEAATRDFRNWIMVSEGLLRKQREDAEASPVPEAEPTPISAEGMAPQALSATAKP
jgi:hypothetical protein